MNGVGIKLVGVKDSSEATVLSQVVSELPVGAEFDGGGSAKGSQDGKQESKVAIGWLVGFLSGIARRRRIWRSSRVK